MGSRRLPAGAPWTVATYMVEGRGSRDFRHPVGPEPSARPGALERVLRRHNRIRGAFLQPSRYASIWAAVPSRSLPCVYGPRNRFLPGSRSGREDSASGSAISALRQASHLPLVWLIVPLNAERAHDARRQPKRARLGGARDDNPGPVENRRAVLRRAARSASSATSRSAIATACATSNARIARRPNCECRQKNAGVTAAK